MERGLFITIEGPDGAGKSTQINFIKSYLEQKGIDAVFTREPGGTNIGEKIRDIILDKENKNMSYISEALLYAAARAQLVQEVIKPALERGQTVICDRFIDSSIAYQGYGRNLGEKVEEINKYAIDGQMPDLTLLLKVEAKKGMTRIEDDNSQRKEKDRLESESMDFHRKVCLGYEDLEKKFADRIRGIDAKRSIEEVSQDIKAHLDLLLKDKYEL